MRILQGVTLKLVALDPVPPEVVTLILPVTAPVGTVAVICVSETTENDVALTPPNVTLVVPFKLFPVIVTSVPTGPLAGEKLKIEGMIRNFRLLVRVPVGVVTVMDPVVAAAGTVAVR